MSGLDEQRAWWAESESEPIIDFAYNSDEWWPRSYLDLTEREWEKARAKANRVLRAMGSKELRVVNERTGGAKGTKPERYDLLPWEAMDDVARVYAMGAEKYDDHNWRKGFDWSLSISAAFRHMAAFAAGEDNDQESGLPHPAHAAFHMLALITYLREHPELDDRYSAPSIETAGHDCDCGRDPDCNGRCSCGLSY